MIQAGISEAFFYRIVWEAIKAIAKSKHEALLIELPQTEKECEEAANWFQSISHRVVINNCVSVVGGFLLGIETFFSGHYKCSGLNIQAACDYHCHFTSMAVTGPGVIDMQCKLRRSTWLLSSLVLTRASPIMTTSTTMESVPCLSI
jgi:hypothetical protein